MLSFISLFGIACMVGISTAVITVEIDLQRNAPGVNNSNIVVVNNAPDPTHLFFIATGDITEIKAANLVLKSLDGTITLTPAIYPAADSKALLVVEVNGFTYFEEFKVVNTNGAAEVIYLFVHLSPQTKILLLSCLNDEIHLKVPASYNQHYLSLVGQELNPECSFQINLGGGNNVKINMSVCGLIYSSTFQIEVRHNEHVNVGEDFVILMKCQSIDTQLELTNIDVISDLEKRDNQPFLTTVKALMFLHMQDDPLQIVTNGIQVKTPVALTITMDPIYRRDFDFVPLNCYVNSHLIVEYGCAKTPMSNFISDPSVGSFTSKFNMFRTLINGIPESNLVFVCTMYICDKGDCPNIPCITTV